MIKDIREYYIADRIELVDSDFLEFEEEMCRKEDLKRILEALMNGAEEWGNPHNSILLYATGLSDVFDFNKGRSEMTGGSPPDIDMDYDPRFRDKIFDYLVKKWGHDCVAQIGAPGTFGMLGTVDALGRISEPLEPKKGNFEDDESYEAAFLEWKAAKKAIYEHVETLKKLVPKPAHGIAPDYKKMVEASPEILEDYPGFAKFAEYADGMRQRTGVHAAGVVLSDFPIIEGLPILKSDKCARFITQFDKDEVEALGYIKFDELVVDALSVIAEAIKYIDPDTNPIEYLEQNIYTKDGDPKAYDILHKGLLTGIFQMETSDSARDLIAKIKPSTISELSDVSALNRPGPLQAGLHTQYIENKTNGIDAKGMPQKVMDILSRTYGVLTYQEQVMQLCSELAGFTLKEADDIRRAMGKKDAAKMAKIEKSFIEGCNQFGHVNEDQAAELWHQMTGFAEYAFNASHSVAYSFITYATMWLKGNYPLQFFTALLSVKSQEATNEKWEEKLPQYMEECKHFGITIRPPDINHSGVGFDHHNDALYFGFAGIKGVAKSSASAIVNARKDRPFKDVLDFVDRVDQRTVNTAKFKTLVEAGCFDRMGYKRQDLLNNIESIYAYYGLISDYNQRLLDMQTREIQRTFVDELKADPEKAKAYKEVEFDESIQLHEEWALGDNIEPCPAVFYATVDDVPLPRKLPALKVKEMPEKLEIARYPKVTLSAKEIRTQQELIGCYLTVHPTQLVKGNFTDIKDLWKGDVFSIRAIVGEIKETKTRAGEKMVFVMLEDGSGSAQATLFEKDWLKYGKLLQPGQLVKGKVTVYKEKPMSLTIKELLIIDGV
jgi:DNA-directed DNA polymerase III PolC